VAVGYVAWKRRKRKTEAREDTGAKREQDVGVETAAALYRALETALHGQGVTRALSTPPLRHAEDLCSRRHPLADEVLTLTNVYLEARFGGATLYEPARRDFERRVREIRGYRPAVSETAR
jgi:hypothetical protein